MSATPWTNTTSSEVQLRVRQGTAGQILMFGVYGEGIGLFKYSSRLNTLNMYANISSMCLCLYFL